LFYAYFHNVNKNIVAFACFNAIIGLASELAAFIPNSFDSPYNFIRLFFEGYWIGFMDFKFDIGIASTSQYLYLANVAANIMLLIGAYQFSKTGGQETRLIRCMLSILLISSILSAIEIAVYSESIVYRGLSLIKCAALAIGSWVALTQIAKTKEIHTPAGAPRTFRFFNWLIDTIVVALTMTPYIIVTGFMSFLQESFGPGMAVLIFSATLQIIYYLFFEAFFKATPGKFVTGTKVISAADTEATTLHIVGRTITRLIPFDGLSFFGSRGWHDSLPGTKVVMEESTVATAAAYPNVIDRME
jgi:uncharacterized RDD family membrane protein YckC